MKNKVTEIPDLATVKKFVHSMFRNKKSVRGETCGERITFNTPCGDFFHADIDCVDLAIAKPIESEFGLECFNFRYSMSCHGYGDRLGESKAAFYKKHPANEVGTPKDTLLRFCEMIYDLIRVKNGLNIA